MLGSNPSTFGGIISIDEIRLYPANSQVETYVYDPLKGISVEFDNNGKATYYEYDLLGRLKVVRDQKRNIVKTYQYNFKQ